MLSRSYGSVYPYSHQQRIAPPVLGRHLLLRVRPADAANRTRVETDCVRRLVRKRKIDLIGARDAHRLGLLLYPFVPCDEVVLAIWDVIDFVVPALVSLGKVRRWADNDVTRHLRMCVAKQRNHAGLVKLKPALFTLRPGAEVVS